MRPGKRPNRRLRVVLDTNVLVSALLWDGNEREVLNLCWAGSLRSITSIEILRELDNVLERRFGLPWARRHMFRLNILRASELVGIIGNLKVIDEDPTDDKVLETAIVGNADFIVTGDRHLLILGIFKDVRILGAGELKTLISDR